MVLVFALVILCLISSSPKMLFIRALVGDPHTFQDNVEGNNTSNTQNQETEDQLKLVDVKVVEPTDDEENRFPKLDLIVRNPGKVAVLKKAVFYVDHVWEWKSFWQPGGIKPSWNYTVTLPILGAPYSHPVDIAQEVPGNGTDRFTFTMGNDAPVTLSKFVFLLHLDLIYNEDNKILSTPKVLFISSAPIDLIARNNGGDRIGAYIHNLKVVQEIGNFHEILSPRMQENIKEYSEDIIPDLIKNLKHEDERQREHVVNFLGRLGYSARIALSDLEQVAVNDQSEKVRVAAQSAIVMIKAAKEKTDPLTIDPNIHKNYPGAPGWEKKDKPKAQQIPVVRKRVSSP
jgi:hypothetical protein